MTLLGLSDEPGDLAGHGPIDPDTARRLAAQAPSFLRLLTHPETGAVLSVGRDRYAVPADLKAWLRVRDETCRFPGCSRRAERCDIDHITHWAHGGTTDHHNLIHLCRKHHRLKHTTPWTVSTEPPNRDDQGDRGDPPDRHPLIPLESRHHLGKPAPSAAFSPAGTARVGPAPSPAMTDRVSPPPSPAGTPRAGSACSPARTPSADVVHWTAPSGRTYLDRAATELARRHERSSDAPATPASASASASASDHSSPEFPEEPPF
jgi:hypothetical protein